MQDSLKVDRTVDARGSFCPGPLMELIKSIQEVPVGTVLDVLSSDKGSAKDIPAWAQKVGHEFLGGREENGTYHILVKKSK